MQWYNSLTLQPEWSNKEDSVPGTAPPLERYDKELLRGESRLKVVNVTLVILKSNDFFCNFIFDC